MRDFLNHEAIKKLAKRPQVNKYIIFISQNNKFKITNKNNTQARMWGRAYFTIYGIDINDLTLHEVGNFRKFHEIFQNLQNCKTSKIQKYLKLF